VQLPDIVPEAISDLNFREKNELYVVSGYIVISVMKNYKTCPRCIASTGSNIVSNSPYSTFLKLKAYKPERLFYVDNKTFHFFLDMDQIFRSYFNKARMIQNLDLKSFFLNKFSVLDVKYNYFPTCHNIKKNLMKRFITFKLKTKNEKKS